MRARIATVAALVSIGVLVTPAATAAECSLVDQIFSRCQETSEPPPPEPEPEPQPEPAPQPAPAPAPEPQPDPGHRPIAVERILALMNGERSSRGLPQLVLRADVSAVSAPHSEDMAEKGTIWHNDAYFTTANKKALQASLLGENVARNTDIDDAHRRLMNSPGHRANILDGRFTVVGLAVYDDGWGNLYVTQNFLQPAPPAAPKAAATEKPRSIPATTQPPAPTTTAAPTTVPAASPEPAVLAAGAPTADVDVAPADSSQAPPPRGPNKGLLAVVALLALGSAAVYAFRAKLHFLGQAADR